MSAFPTHVAYGQAVPTIVLIEAHCYSVSLSPSLCLWVSHEWA